MSRLGIHLHFYIDKSVLTHNPSFKEYSQSTVTQKEVAIGGMVLVLILSEVFGVNNHGSFILGVSPPLEDITGILSYQATSILYH